METTIDGEMESSLLHNFNQIYNGYKDAILEIQSLKLKFNSENNKCEALQSACNDLKFDNERLRRLYTETLFKFTNQMKYHTEYQSLKEELDKVNSKLLSVEQEHRRRIETINQENDIKVRDLEEKLSCSVLERANKEARIKQMQLDLSSLETHVGILTDKLDQVTADVDAQYQNEMQEMKVLITIGQEEKKELQKKLQNAENELRVVRSRQAEQQRDSVSIHHVETLKQKIMKLRKENESLKRKLLLSEFDSA